MRFTSLAELPAQHRRQVEEKLALLPRARVTTHATGRPRTTGNKYHAQVVEADGVRFASKKEMRCYLIQKAREEKGEIQDLRVHVKFSLFDPGLAELHRAGSCPGEHIGTYTCDFTWRENGRLVVADAKSEKTRRLREWPRTKALLKACHGHEVREL
jgi:hypothetical protein